MDEVYTLHVGRYWSELLCCTVKVMDLEILGCFYKSISPEYIDGFG